MGVLQCLEIAIPAIFTAALATVGPLAFSVYKTGVRATAVYLTKLPTRLLGFALVAFRQKVTVVLASLTAFRGTIIEFGNTLRSGGSVTDLFLTGFGDLWSQILLAPRQVANGFAHFLSFLSTSGVCGKLVKLDLLFKGLVDLWTGVAAVVIIVFVYKVFRFRVQKTRPDRFQIGLMLLAVFGTAAAVQAGLEGTEFYRALSKGQSLAEQLSGFLDVGGNVSVNESVVNESTNSSAG